MLETLKPYATLPVRLILGSGFVYHGYGKLFSAEGHQMFQGMLQNIGVPAASLMSWVVGAVEFFGGLALIVGAFVAIVGVLQIGVMLTALFTVHLSNGFNFIHITGMTDAGPQFGMPGYEVNLLYIAGLAVLVLGGAGALSVDQRLSTGQARKRE